MQNFNDILNGVSDGSKDLSISALTCAGTVTMNGAINLGNATSDDVTFTGRIASDFDPKTAATYAFGDATQTWQALFLDNGVTDGGAVYFNASSTAFIKSDASAGDLDISGFTNLDINALNLKGTGDLAPGTGSAEDIGTTSLPYRALYLDNSATDAGAIYFNAGTTAFLKATADGSELDFDGFTTLDLNTGDVAGVDHVFGALNAVGDPTYSFTGDTNTGMYSTGADALAFATGGVKALEISSSQTSTFTAGVTVDGSADAIQLTVQGNATQTSDIFVVEKSDGTDLLEVTNVNGTKIRGTTTNDTASSGFIGEKSETEVTTAFTQATPTSNTWYDVTNLNLALTAGDWDIYVQVPSKIVWSSGAGTTAYLVVGLRDSGGTVYDKIISTIAGDDASGVYAPRESVQSCSFGKTVQISSTTTFKVSMFWKPYSGSPTVGSIGTYTDSGEVNCRLWARRAR